MALDAVDSSINTAEDVYSQETIYVIALAAFVAQVMEKDEHSRAQPKMEADILHFAVTRQERAVTGPYLLQQPLTPKNTKRIGLVS